MNKELNIEASSFLQSYMDEMTNIMIKMNPEWNEDDVQDEMKKIIKKDIMIPEVELDNNYTKEHTNSSLLSVLDWAIDSKPIIAGNGTFFKRHEDSKNPIADMLDDWFYGRKAIKKEMFNIDDIYSKEYAHLDLDQGNQKVLMNSYYGSSGAQTSAFFNLWTATSTTLSAQSVISTTEQTFEAFLSDNYVFIDINECYHWMECILNESDNTIDDWVIPATFDEVYDRIKHMVLDWDYSYEEGLNDYLHHLTDDELTKIFYKNNLIEFTRRHEKVKQLHRKIFKNVNNYQYMEDDDSVIPKELRQKFTLSKNKKKDWNKFVDKEYFYDPNDVPESILGYIKEMCDIYLKYVYVRYLSIDRIYRLKNFKRKVVTVIDTDSNILSLDTWINFLFDEVLGDESQYNRDHINNVFIAVNSITYVITNVVTDILLYYGKCSNVEEKWRPRFNMKNEFFFSKLIIGKTKKRYISKVMLREGNLIKNGKSDVKGFDFKKATTSEFAEKRYMKLINDILLVGDGIDLKKLTLELKKFREEIKESILNGDKKYLPNGNAKELEAYKDPSTNQSVRGVLSWNMTNPNNQISFPAKVSLVKMNINTPEDIEPMKDKYPDIYNIIMEGIFNDRSGIFIKRNKKGEVKITGLQVLAIPSNDKIPEWAMDYIDYTTMINTILAPFKSVMEIFDLPDLQEGKTGRKTKTISNIIKF